MEKIKRKDGKFSYREMIRINGKTHKKTFRRKADAVTWKAKMTAKRIHIELHGAVKILQLISFSTFSTNWLEEKIKTRNSIGTYKEYKRNCEKHLIPIVGTKKLSDIRASDADKLVYNLCNRGHNAGGVNQILALFKTIMLEAERQEFILKSPLRHYANLKEKQLSYQFWITGEANEFLRSIPKDVYYALYVVALNTGMRKGELCALTWDKIDFNSKKILVSRILSRYGFKDTTKNSKHRYIPMNDIIGTLLFQLKETSKSEFVFSREGGEHLPYGKVTDRFQRQQSASGVDKILRFHDLRHTFASNYMMSGGEIYTLQKILGHSKITQTERYAHLSPDHLANTTQILSFSGENKEVYPDSNRFLKKETEKSNLLVM